MNPKESRHKRPYATPRTVEEIIPLAEDFIKQYYDSKKQWVLCTYNGVIFANWLTFVMILSTFILKVQL